MGSSSEGDSWTTSYNGTIIGRNWGAKFNPVRAQEIRLEILESSDGPTIRDIQFRSINSDVEIETDLHR
jgi:hypothetical protein